MRKALPWALVVLAIGSAAAQRRREAPPRAAAHSNPLGHSEPVIAQGREIYNRSCTVCHGLNGAAGDRGPALAGTRRYLRSTDQDLFEAIRNGITGTEMPPSGLPSDDTWKVVAYIRSLRSTASDAFVPGDPARGREIFWAKGRCGECHMVQGRGGLLGPDLTNIGAERTLRAIRETLTQARPSALRGYQPVEILTAEGETLTGILKNEDNFSLQLLDSENKLRLLLRSELRQVVYKEGSLMPASYGKALAPAELQNLLAFLSRQAVRKPEQELTDDDQ